MAKLKIRKLVRDQQMMGKRMDELTALLAYVTHRMGGEVVFTPEDIMKVPDGIFSIKSLDGNVILSIEYNPAEEGLEAEAQEAEQTAEEAA